MKKRERMRELRMEKGRYALAQPPLGIENNAIAAGCSLVECRHWYHLPRVASVDVDLDLMTNIYAETSSALDFVPASLSLASGGGKLRRREGSHGRSFHL